MKIKTISCLLSLALCTMLSANDTIHVVLLGGQSNMAGRGVCAELDASVQTRISELDGRVLYSSGSRSARPLGGTKQFGPELLMGLTLAEANPEQRYLFIKTAVGGTSLHGAWSPNWTEAKAQISEHGAARKKMKLYSDHLSQIRTELAEMDNRGQPYEIIGMAWMQGEKDTRLEVSAENYAPNLATLITAYRTDLSLPEMLFVVGQVNNPLRGKKDYAKGPELVRTSQEKVASVMKNVVLVPTSTDPSWSDYPKLDDNVHYNTEGQTRLGKAFAEALLSLEN